MVLYICILYVYVFVVRFILFVSNIWDMCLHSIWRFFSFSSSTHTQHALYEHTNNACIFGHFWISCTWMGWGGGRRLCVRVQIIRGRDGAWQRAYVHEQAAEPTDWALRALGRPTSTRNRYATYARRQHSQRRRHDSWAPLGIPINRTPDLIQLIIITKCTGSCVMSAWLDVLCFCVVCLALWRWRCENTIAISVPVYACVY